MKTIITTDKNTTLSGRRPFSSMALLATVLTVGYLPQQITWAHGPTPPSLKGVTVPATPGLLDGAAPIVVNKTAAIRLGKALFWDSSIGSDGQACASCHFHAGADRRIKNQLSTGDRHTGAPTALTFEPTASGAAGGPNYLLKQGDFPLHKLADPNNKYSAVLFTTDDIVSSAGNFNAEFVGLGAGGSTQDICTPVLDGIYHIGSLQTRRVQARNSPTVINAAFNYRNFWDGRANNVFNGVSEFGPRDPNGGVWEKQGDGTVLRTAVNLINASLASQAIAPPINSSEMSCAQRKMPDIARKILNRRALQDQAVHAKDGVLGVIRDASGIGLNKTYRALIRAAFANRYWSGTGDFGAPTDGVSPPYTHMEANFSFFFGLAIQLYEQTLISDDSPFDSPRITEPGTGQELPTALNEQQIRGMKVFLDSHCQTCHAGPTQSGAAHPLIVAPLGDSNVIDRMNVFGVSKGLLDKGYFNTGVAPTENDAGVGGADPFGKPLSFSMQYLQALLDGTPAVDAFNAQSCFFTAPFTQSFTAAELVPDPRGTLNCGGKVVYAKVPNATVVAAELAKPNQGRMLTAVNGAFKVPSLRNVELTGPYMHNGSMLTLEQVVDFYGRIGNFDNPHQASTFMGVDTASGDKADLVAFLKTLTDERVRWEKAPFDHPQLKIPNGHKNVADPLNPSHATDNFITLPAIGKNGRSVAQGPLKPTYQYMAP